MNKKELVESLSPNERKIIPYLNEKKIEKIIEKSGLDRVSVLRALEFLNSKKIIRLDVSKRKIVDLGTNGIFYKKKGLPERQLLYLIEKNTQNIESAQKSSKLSQNEFRAAFGVLKKKALIEVKNEKIFFIGSKDDITKKTLEEQFLDQLPLDFDSLSEEQKFALNNLRDRKDIVEVREEQVVYYELTDIGKDIMDENLGGDFIEQITSEMILSGSWKGKKFRRYDLISHVPKIYGGKRHFVNQAVEHSRKIWTEMGFKEMSGSLIMSSFWNFDSLFTAQDHSVRELQDTFFLDENGKLPDKKVIERVKKAHESGVAGSKGWRYQWNENEAKKLVLRTHTTCLSAQTLANLDIKELPQKFFAIGKCFRNETVDWSHGFEFSQTEGIVVDKNANFKHLFGYLQEFFKKMGFKKIRFRPAYFPYTEPSVEIDFYNEEKKKWLELGGAGIFRPEVVVPLLGEFIPVLAWGSGLDRIIMDYYKIKDLRDMYKNNISQLREMKFWRMQ